MNAERNLKFIYRLLFNPAVLLIIIIGSSCTQSYTPKERGYFRMTLPTRGPYQVYNAAQCPFTFEYPSYSNIVYDTKFLDTVPDNPCWMNIEMPSLNGTVYISYKAINDKNDLAKLVEDAHNLTYRHTVKASYINPIALHPHPNVYGLYYDVGGNAASNVQFFITDSTHNFIRGALYFRNAPNIDSIAPVLNFVKHDISHMINTLQWK
jgi:gliding motility-associated lipoprotein GldD